MSDKTAVAAVKTTVKEYTIDEFAKAAGIKTQYVRTMLRQGRITSRKEARNGTNVFRNLITQETLDNYLATKGTRTPNRNDGRARFVLYATQAELDKIKKDNPGVVIEKPKSNYNREKAKAYRAKRAETKRLLASGKIVAESK